mgnify:FL=1
MAMAYGSKPFTPPRIALRMWETMGEIANLWSEEGDVALTKALVENKVDLSGVTYVEPWGWDEHLRKRLLKLGINEDCMPDAATVERIRQLSNRRTYVDLLSTLRCECCETVGEARYLQDSSSLNSSTNIILKAPWSSSGRGVRAMNEKTMPWAEKTIREQGGIMVEPLYNKVCDFAMEFVWNPIGVRQIEYLGLSLFRNTNDGRAYEGNILASEEYKQQLLSRYVDIELVAKVRCVIAAWMAKQLKGLDVTMPFGVDMMIVDEGGKLKLHPCVEVNLRRTMGYVALKVYDQIRRGMLNENIIYNGTEYEKENFVGYFSVDANSGKCTVCKQGMESRQW